jgi:hypothetical protein
VILDLYGLLADPRFKHQVAGDDVEVRFYGLLAVGKFVAFKQFIIVLVIGDRKFQAQAVFQNEVEDVLHPRSDLLNVNKDM